MKNSFKEYFKNKKITMMGLGVLGRGIGVAKFLVENGAELLITDLKEENQLTLALTKLEPYKEKITYILGEHRLEDFRNCDFIIKAADVPLNSLFIAEAKKNNIPIKMDASLFCELAPTRNIIGITGTKGKSTVTELVYRILKSANKKVFLGGNIRGIATLPLLNEVEEGDWVVLELDSWQLQGFGDAHLSDGRAGISPKIAVFTNIMPDHMNYYGGDMKKYFKDKANIFLFQRKKDYLICGREVAKSISTRSQKIIFEKDKVPKNWNIVLRGEHNKENIACAHEVAKVLNIPDTVVKNVAEHFKGVSGRLSLVGEINGVQFYNDTTATIPQATIAALYSFDEPIILIAGGADKNSNYEKLSKIIPEKTKKLILLPGTGGDMLIELLPKNFQYEKAESMKEAVTKAVSFSEEGDIVLLSPATASFGLFKNEFDRGDQFEKSVREL